MSVQIDRFSYDDAIVRKFTLMTLVWGVVGMLVGVLVALQLAAPVFNFELPFLSFGRLRPLHTNAVIFAFTGNAIFAGVYYSMQRLLKTPMFSKVLSEVHFWGWQAIIVAAAVTLPLGITQSKEYAELQWPIDIAIAVVWVVFGVNAFGTIARRRERHIYVAIWFYIATIVTIALLHIFNNLVVPAGLWRSYPIYAGVQDAFMQWWYGHNAVGFLLTTPLLGIMYYFLPKAADRPVFSYRLSIIHFWSLVFIYIWAGPHHLHYTALPAWASTLGMLFSLMLWMPSWGGMLNGLLTLRGAWHKVASDPVLKFFVVAVTFYGMSTFEGPLLSIRSVNLLSHYTDWTIAHVHSGALGWVGFLSFGMIYWLLPRLFQTELWSRTLAEAHFWLGTIGILLYIVAIYAAGLTQGLMWLAFDDEGYLKYGDFVETTLRLIPMYWVRVIGGTAYLTGTLLLGLNFFMTWRRRPATYEVPVHEAPRLAAEYVERPEPASPLAASGAHVANLAYKLERFFRTTWHRRWERLPLTFTVAVVVAVVVASLFEIIPTFLIRSNVPTIATVTPYTPLELAGRDIYISEGCYNCHSQMVRPIRAETERYGEYSKPGEFVWDHPFQWGSRRIGPDLHRVGGKYPDLWHVRHMADPRAITAGSIMPAYPWLLTAPLDVDSIERVMRAHRALGVPYSDSDIAGGAAAARAQAAELAARVVEQGGPEGLADKQIVALTAYLQRLGTDITKPEPVAVEEEAGSVAAPQARSGEAGEAVAEAGGEGAEGAS
ncbi:MAG: cytochrome-c oxidase, cbb3-type subunit I [Thermoanaerobaculales bacterium]|nr:cytochrome-c oxidase, cbb3-type subunit I [Thermoanaerobaculales bacterium]